MFPGISGSYLPGLAEDDENSRPTSPGGIAIPRHQLGRPHSPGKFRNEGLDKNSKANGQNEDQLIRLDVIVTPGQLKDMMKCAPSEELVSRAGMAMKRSFPELAKAAKLDAQEKEKLQNKKEQVSLPCYHHRLVSHSINAAPL